MKDQIQGCQLIIVASSSSRPTTIKGNPLMGVKNDIRNFKECFKENAGFMKQIQTSQNKQVLANKEFILGTIRESFRQCIKTCLFYYTGHGHENGHLLIDTTQVPSGEPFSFQQILSIWREVKKPCQNAQLIIILDSCYSGKWVQFMRKQQSNQKIEIYVSSESSKVSKDGARGGIFSTCLFCEEDELQWNFEYLEEHEQKPMNFKDGLQEQMGINNIKELRNKLKQKFRMNFIKSQTKKVLKQKENLVSKQAQKQDQKQNPQKIQNIQKIQQLKEEEETYKSNEKIKNKEAKDEKKAKKEEEKIKKKEAKDEKIAKKEERKEQKKEKNAKKIEEKKDKKK